MANERKVRVLLTKSDQDCHDRGVRFIAKSLRDAGMEVIIHRYPLVDEVINAAEQEDVDIIGFSFFGSGLMYDMNRAMSLLKERDMMDVPTIVGGTLVKDERIELLKMGVAEAFLPNMGTTQDIIDCIKSLVHKKRNWGSKNDTVFNNS